MLPARTTAAPPQTNRPIGAPIRRAATPQGRAAVLALPPSSGWIATAHPADWGPVRDDSGQWHILPRLAKTMLLPGVGGVSLGRDASGQRVADARRVIAERVASGAVEVPRTTIYANGEEYADYCVRYPVVGGACHVWAWERPELARAGRSTVKPDRDAQVAFLKYVAHELLGMAEPEPDTFDALRNDLRTKAVRLAIGATQSPTRRQALDRIAEILRSLGWDDGLDLPASQVRWAHPEPEEAEPAPDQSAEIAQLRAQLAAMSAQLASLTAAPAAAASPAAPPPAQGVVVGSPSAAEAALSFLDEGSAPKPKTLKG